VVLPVRDVLDELARGEELGHLDASVAVIDNDGSLLTRRSRSS
jgi:hypothetical protein